MNSLLSESAKQPIWISIGLLVFALGFLVVGMMRVVEFNGLGLSAVKKRILMAGHILGCLLFASALALLALDVQQKFNILMSVFLFSSILILIPIHIYLGILRRIKRR